jgi:RimJ/RimL family protein N-acetyltransferase
MSLRALPCLESAEEIGSHGFDSCPVGKSHRAEVGYGSTKPFWGRSIRTAVV